MLLGGLGAGVFELSRMKNDSGAIEGEFATAAAGFARVEGVHGADVWAMPLLTVPGVSGAALLAEWCVTGMDRDPIAHLAQAGLLVVGYGEDGAPLVRKGVDRGFLKGFRQGEGGGCVTVAEGFSPGQSMRLELVMTGHEPELATLGSHRGRALWEARLGPVGRVASALSLLGVLLALFGVTHRGRLRPPFVPRPEPRQRQLVALFFGACGLFVLSAQLIAFLLPGATPARRLLAGGALALAELIIAFALMPRGHYGRRFALGLHMPAWPAPVTAAVVPLMISGMALSARLFVDHVPSTGEAPIERYLSAADGAFAFGLLALFAPVPEELFFRGFIYRVGAGFGRFGGLLLSTVVFSVLHLPQTWGAWGASVSILFAGLCLGALRQASGSVVLPAWVHLGYNAMLSLRALWG